MGGHRTIRLRLAPAAALAALALLAGCGSSKPTSSITVGAESGAASSTPASTATAPATTTPPAVHSGSGQTPASGPLSKQPKVTPPSGPAPAKLISKDLIVGSGPAAKTGDTVSVNYVGVLYKGGQEFDASWKRNQPFSFPLGQGQVIPGWDQGVAGMKVGGRRELIIPSALAYGPMGQPPTIPPNAPLVFVIDMLGIQGA
jgi:peptidylprolyl isomerase